MKKLSKRIIALIIAMTMSLTACSKKSGKVVYTTERTSSTLALEEDIVFQESKIPLESYYEYFDDYEVTYPYSEYLTSDSDLEIYQSIIDSYQECDFYYDSDADSLFNQIYQNTLDYISKNPEYINLLDDDYARNLYELNSDSNRLLADIIEVASFDIKRIIDDFLENRSEPGIHEDIHRMLDLKVILDLDYMPNLDDYSNVLLGTYDANDNIIKIFYNSFLVKYNAENNKSEIISPSTILKDSMLKEKTYDKLSQTIKHEISHMRQHICPDRKQKGQLNKTISHYQTGIPALLESSATSSQFLENTDFFSDASYFDFRQFESDLLMLTLTDNNSSIEDYYASIFNSDIASLLSYFNLTTPSDKKAFLNILNSYDGLNIRNTLIFDILNREVSDSINKIESIQAIGYNYKLDIMRLAFKNIVLYGLNNDDLSLEEYITLRDIIMYQISTNSRIPHIDEELEENKWTFEFDETFVLQFKELVDQFNAFLKNKFCLNDAEFNDFLNSQPESYSFADLQNSLDFGPFQSLAQKFPKLNFIMLNLNKVDNRYYKRLLVK